MYYAFKAKNYINDEHVVVLHVYATEHSSNVFVEVSVSNKCDLIKQNESEFGSDMLLISDYFVDFKHTSV